jgi:hypothetical protein
MATKYQPNPRVKQIFEDLENYLQFCKDFGYKFDEAELYSNKSFAYRQYNKHITGKTPKNMWEQDMKLSVISDA